MCGRAAEGNVPVLRSLASAWRAERDRGRVPRSRTRSLRRGLLRPEPDALRREIRREAELHVEPQGRRRPRQKGVLRGERQRRHAAGRCAAYATQLLLRSARLVGRAEARTKLELVRLASQL